MISYESHFSLLQHLPTISSHMFTRLLSNGSLGYIKSAIQIDRIIIFIRLLLTDAHKAAFISDGQNGSSMLDNVIPNTTLTSVCGLKFAPDDYQVTTTMSDKLN